MFTLRDECGLDIARAFALVSVNPAKAAGIADEVGSLAVGKRADVLLVREIACGEAGTRTMPVVTRAFVGGHSVFRSHYPDQPLGYARDLGERIDAARADAARALSRGGVAWRSLKSTISRSRFCCTAWTGASKDAST